MNHPLKNIFLFLLVTAIFVSCSKSNTATPPATLPVFAKGADVSWLTQMEASGIKFYNSQGTQQECMSLLKDLGINSIRLRAWVNPPAGWNNTKDVVAKAVRAQALGMRIMIDFHYSDTWADPSHQPKPAAWSTFNIGQLTTAVSTYTTGVMDTLKLSGITPDWVQIGNETNDGMLWEDGRASASMANFANLIKAGYAAVKSVSPTSQVIVHLSNGYDNSLFTWMFDGLKANGVSWDIIGMSLYPAYAPQGNSGWAAVNTNCLSNMTSLIARYGTPVMVVEVGMPYNDPADAKSFLLDILTKTKNISGNNGLGVFYWEPECYNNWQGYTLGAFDNTGKPTAAMDAFLN
ncbi:MAG: arabinogalactan endo-1,4-beta-galactosidase [Cytophagales bacterium]|jgi:arabinogalactan endo-1,4-beta-galactosidase|nr:glycosyl hydrolase 53 family protein [Bacteroidota bacterium]MBS1982063.1 glycosyl hydrolase 53 family protein [Bacteroidota bacterium]WHZ06466.1 MAG: arabinogalactan endo-1,4-beta-galactosidase [Cytophagales bacterium]